MQNNSLIQWSPKQTKLMELLADPMDDRTKAEKASALGISPRTLYKWQKLAGWNEAVYQLTLQFVGGELPGILRAVAAKARAKGDVSAAKLLLEACGLLQGNGTTIINNASNQQPHFNISEETARAMLAELKKNLEIYKELDEEDKRGRSLENRNDEP